MTEQSRWASISGEANPKLGLEQVAYALESEFCAPSGTYKVSSEYGKFTIVFTDANGDYVATITGHRNSPEPDTFSVDIAEL